MPLIVLALLLPDAHAWGMKEHLQMTRMAAVRIIEDEAAPAGLRRMLLGTVDAVPDLAAERAWFVHAEVGPEPVGAEGLVAWAVHPDIDKDAVVEPYGVESGRLHYLNVEVFHRRASGFEHDLSARPELDDIPRDIDDERFQDSGYLPFRVEECFEELRDAFAAGRLDGDGAAMWAGLLAHYVQDNTNPHHATVDFRGESWFPDLSDPPDMHAVFEWQGSDGALPREQRGVMFDRMVAALEAWEPLVEPGDPWAETVEMALLSYGALGFMGQASVAALDDEGQLDVEAYYAWSGTLGADELSILELKARQMALGIARTEAMWRRAWDAAQR